MLENIYILYIFIILYMVIAEQQIDESQKIVGGNETDISETPYQVAVLIRQSLCGGVIIRDRWVLTAAHCVSGEPVRDLQIRAGSNYYLTGLPFVVLLAITHPDYDSLTNNNDIALLKLMNPIVPNSRINKTELATTLPPIDSKLLVSGYGTVQFNGNLATRLKSANVYMNNITTCNTTYNGEITENMFCAAAPGNDSCQGDSGGPIVYEKKLIGIVSWGYRCAEDGYPGVYTNVIKYRKWIESSIISTLTLFD